MKNVKDKDINVTYGSLDIYRAFLYTEKTRVCKRKPLLDLSESPVVVSKLDESTFSLKKCFAEKWRFKTASGPIYSEVEIGNRETYNIDFPEKIDDYDPTIHYINLNSCDNKMQVGVGSYILDAAEDTLLGQIKLLNEGRHIYGDLYREIQVLYPIKFVFSDDNIKYISPYILTFENGMGSIVINLPVEDIAICDLEEDAFFSMIKHIEVIDFVLDGIQEKYVKYECNDDFSLNSYRRLKKILEKYVFKIFKTQKTNVDCMTPFFEHINLTCVENEKNFWKKTKYDLKESIYILLNGDSSIKEYKSKDVDSYWDNDYFGTPRHRTFCNSRGRAISILLENSDCVHNDLLIQRMDVEYLIIVNLLKCANNLKLNSDALYRDYKHINKYREQYLKNDLYINAFYDLCYDTVIEENKFLEPRMNEYLRNGLRDTNYKKVEQIVSMKNDIAKERFQLFTTVIATFFTILVSISTFIEIEGLIKSVSAGEQSPYILIVWGVFIAIFLFLCWFFNRK